MQRRLANFERRHQAWLERDALYEVLRALHGGRGFRDWRRDDGPHPDQDLWNPAPGEQSAAELRRAGLAREHRQQLDAFAFRQMLVHEQHARLRALCRDLGLALYGDLQIGLADQDVFAYRGVILRDYVMGAPPSRTTPEGQAWNYAVLDPAQSHSSEPGRDGALRLLLARVDKMFDEYDAVRIDHPHGWVCPWVYRAGQADPLFAVQHGARLHGAPDLPDHPELARFAIAEPDQLDRALPRYADDWERDLRPEQIDRYAVFFDAMVASARSHGRDRRDVVCEVLSTLPRPLAAVLARHGLGRFRVVQKANLDDACRRVPARERAARGLDHGRQPRHAADLERGPDLDGDGQTRALGRAPRAPTRPGPRRACSRDPGALVHALFAEMLASAAENVSVFFTDLFGFDEPYNVPGTISDDNWSLRLGPDFERDYADKVRRGEALNLPRALAMAFGGRGPEFRGHTPGLRRIAARGGRAAGAVQWLGHDLRPPCQAREHASGQRQHSGGHAARAAGTPGWAQDRGDTAAGYARRERPRDRG